MNTIWLGNTPFRWLAGIAAGFVVYFLLKYVLKSLRNRVLKVSAPETVGIADLILGLVKATSPIFLFALALFSAARFVDLPSEIRVFLTTATLIVALVQIGMWGMSSIDHAVKKRAAIQDSDSGTQETSLTAVSLVIKIALWVLIIVLVLDNIPGINATTLITSLGIGGIAVGLAVQSILGDLFSSLTISLDKPFIIGDFIKVGELSGTVEHIGLKSTRIRSVSGEQLIFTNSDLLSSRVQNFRRMERRRDAFQIGVTYQTSLEQLKMIPVMIQKIIESLPNTIFERANFSLMGDFALIFNISYFLTTSDYQEFTNTRQAINLEILRQFAEAGIEFAHPNQMIFSNPKN